MTSDVVLTAALRNNLLSLQNTQSVIDIAQNRLSTGRKVNSALDNPQSFFASQALNNRASDLTRLLDTIGQSIQVIKAADNGVTALTKLVEQADSIAQSARDALAEGQVQAKVVGNRDLRSYNDLAALPGITTGDDIILSITNAEGIATNLGSYNTTAGSAAAAVTIDIATNESIEDIIAEINSIVFEATVGSTIANGAQAFEASLDAAGQLQIRTLAGNDFRAQFNSVTATGSAGDAADLALASDLGFADIAKLLPVGGATNNNSTEFTAVADVALRSFALYDGSVVPREIAQRSDLLNNLVNTAGTALFTGLNAATDDYLFGINGGARTTIELVNAAASTGVTIQDFIDDINTSAALNTLIRAEYDDATGILSIRTIDPSVKSIEVGTAASAQLANFGFGRNGATPTAATNQNLESISLAAAAGDLAQFETDFNRLRDQIDLLVADTGYRGTNLLSGDSLVTYFNENRSSSLETEGETFTADGLGLSEANFARTDTVDGALAEIRDALESVRAFGSSLANDLTVIQTRQTFTTELINTLQAGSDALTVADQNEEGAKLLALQTRQQLGVTALSLASQSQQSILRLF